MAGPDESRPAKSRDLAVGRHITRSKTSPYNKDVCLFWRRRCRFRHTLHKVSTFSEVNRSVPLWVCQAMTNSLCFSVTNILRKPTSANDSSCRLLTSEIAFLATTEKTLREGKIATMSELQASFEIVLGANNVADPTYNRKALQQLPDEVHKRAMSLAQSTVSICSTPGPN